MLVRHTCSSERPTKGKPLSHHPMVGRPFPQRSTNDESACADRSISHSSPVFQLLQASEWLLPLCFLPTSMAAHWYFPTANLFWGPTSWSTCPPVLQLRAHTGVTWLLTIMLGPADRHMATMEMTSCWFSFVLFIEHLIITLSENKDNTL